MEPKAAYRNRVLIIRVIGCILLCIGAFLALLAPLEYLCFPQFSEGGRFHYEGFGFGSFMYGLIVGQIIIYSACAAVFILLGYGHIRLRRWAWKLSVPVLWAWLAVGLPVVLIAFFILAGTKNLSPVLMTLAYAFLFACYFIFPALLLRFYNLERTKASWTTNNRTRLTDRTPVQTLTLCVILVFYILLMQMSTLFSVPFPVFGIMLTGTAGIIVNEVSAALFAVLLWGLLRRRVWAWRMTTAFISLLLVSSVVTYCAHSYPEILAALSFPSMETQILSKLPIQGYHMAIFFALPYTGGCIAAILSKKGSPALQP